MEQTLLLVDDEENILRSLKRALRRDGYNILCAGSGEEGLSLLENNDVGVVISDQRMPEMTGIEFLTNVRNKYPHIVRMVLSGYTDLESVTNAINLGAIYKFLTKPWEESVLRLNVKEAFSHFELERENRRLTHELELANGQLSALNRDLELSLQASTLENMISLKSLHISQDILDNLPVAVLGIGNDGVIAVANKFAHELFNNTGYCLVGCDAETVLPAPIREMQKNVQNGNAHINNNHSVIKGHLYCIHCTPLINSAHSDGTIVMIRSLE